jgi:hypothetical protein
MTFTADDDAAGLADDGAWAICDVAPSATGVTTAVTTSGEITLCCP